MNMYTMDLTIGSYKFRLEILILIVVVSWILFGHLLCGCCRVSLFEGMEMAKNTMKKAKEGFTGANNSSYGPEFAAAKSPDYILNPSTWSAPTLTYSPGTAPDAGVKAIWDRPNQPIPLPKGELDFFATTKFKPECCPNAYSSSTGCACMTVKQYDYLQQRGGNNVPYSEY
jgi:hypothetical protein